jgi:hypothetical protein
MQNYTSIIFYKYEHLITNLPPHIVRVAVIGEYVHSYNCLHNGLALLYVESTESSIELQTDCNNYDNLPPTLKILRFVDVDIVNKINSFPESLIEITFHKYTHLIDNLPASLKYLIMNCRDTGKITYVPFPLFHFSSNDTDQSYNVIPKFYNNLKYFEFKGHIKVDQFNRLPDSVEVIFINREFDVFRHIKYPKNLTALYLEEYGMVNFDTIPEGVETLQVGEVYIDLITPAKLPSTLKDFTFLNNYSYHDINSDAETETDTDNDDNDGNDDEHNGRPLKKLRLENKKQILIDYLTHKGVQISYND